LSTYKSYPDILFFLGAGASIDAGLVGVVELKHKFMTWLEKNSKSEHLSLQEKRSDKNPVDIEFLLETVEKIENKDEDPLPDFYENKLLKLEKNGSYNSIMKIKKDLSTMIKRFIKTYFSQTNIQTDYLQCIKDLKYSRPLHIFSTNYDTCIEQLCKKNDLQLIDAFDPNLKLQKREYEKQNVDVILYKLHGSITWHRTEKGDYARSDIIPTTDERVSYINGQDVVPVILYLLYLVDY
jgi:hypothetical protein